MSSFLLEKIKEESMNRKFLIPIIIIGLAVGIFAEPLDKGLTWLKTSAGVLFSNTVLGDGDVVYSKWYSSEEIGYYNSVRVVFDELNGGFTVVLELEESWDGENDEFTTQLLSTAFETYLDTVLEVNLYPAPYLRLKFTEKDAALTESLAIDTVAFFSHD